jgi:monothiol glutaredoxin
VDLPTRSGEDDMNLDDSARERIRSLIESSHVVLFMKGNRDEPRCGFSATVVDLLDRLIPDYHTVDVLADEALREQIKSYAEWPTIPQLYVGGEFVGGCDIVKGSFASGELHGMLGVAGRATEGAAVAPTLSIDDRSAEQLRNATAQAPPEFSLRLAVDARYRARMLLGPAEDGDSIGEANGVTLRLDPLSAARAEGAQIDLVQSKRGAAFRVSLPNSPFAVKPMTAKELERCRSAGESFELFDVRSPEERARAAIPGAQHVDAQQVQRIEALPRDTMLVFHCHRGNRSQSAAEHFASLGFTNVHRLVGGIDAWSVEVDPSVPRY